MKYLAWLALIGTLAAQSAPITSRYEAVADTGSLNAASVTLAQCPGYASNGLTVSFLPAFSNTSTAPTLAVCGWSATITKNGGNALVSSDYASGTIATVRYNLPSNRWELQNPLSATSSGLTSVGLSTNLSFMTVGASPLTTNGTLTLNGTTGETANEFVATPNGSTGVVGLRTIVAADVPTLNQSTSGNAATATALAATPSQCSGTGSVALGVAASGNSNCGYPSQSYVQAYLTGSNVTMTSTTGTFYDGPSTGAVAAGTWFVSGYVTLGKASATGQNLVQCKLWDGTTTFATAETSVPYVTAAAATYTVVHLNAVAVEASGGTIKISCENSVASGIIYYQTPTSTLADASGISAVRIQ